MQPSEKNDFISRTTNNISIMASVEAFKSAVLRIRDILRGPGVNITGMDSMRHLCLYILSRYMTKDKVKILGVPDEFAWENLIDMAQTKNGGVQKALDCFFHKETDCLVNHFDRLFGTENFSFDIKNPAKHKEMLEILDKINMEQIDCQMDTLGWVYEQHLKTGSSSSARDLGQFFTDRFICEYMVALCKPGFKSKGVPESVCDPSMGTGGFLTSYIKFYKKHHANKHVDWSIQNKEIHGCDTDPKVAGVARLNLFMESGGNRAINLKTHDSLYGDLPLTGYDIILANMPFGLKGLKHADCCERVKELKIRSTKSEPLFLQLMMVSLNSGGRCAVIVPDGMLVNSAEHHCATRKHMLDNFNLKRIIKMRGQFFMNTTIQPSILFFEKTSKVTSAVEFWDVSVNENGNCIETMILSVKRDKFDDKYSFDLAKYQVVEKMPYKFPCKLLSEIALCKNGKNIPEKNRKKTDIYPYYASNGINGYVDKFNFTGPAALLGDQGSRWASSAHFVENGEKFYAGNHTLVMISKGESINIKYIYYFLKLNNLEKFNKPSTGIPELDKERFLEINIPIPSKKEQDDIVERLDIMYKAKEEALQIVNNTDNRAITSLDSYLNTA